jgi:hypothetical protein
MKTIPIILFAMCVIGNAETADEIARQAIMSFAAFDNGLDCTPEGRRKTALNNAEFGLAHYMASDKVPESVRIPYALKWVKAQMRMLYYKGADVMNGEEALFDVDQEGVPVFDEEMTRLMRAQSAKNLEILEQRLVEIYNPQAEQDGAGKPATAPESKAEGKEKPIPESEERPQ